MSPRGRPGGRGLWLAAGAAVLLAAATLGLVSAIKHKGGAAKGGAPDDPAAGKKGGQILAQTSPAGKQPGTETSPGRPAAHPGGTVEPADADRRAAEWVLSVGGKVRVRGGEADITDAAKLPREPFVLTTADVALIEKATDDGVAVLKSCRHLTRLDLFATSVTDRGLANFKGCTTLVHFAISGEGVTDAGLANFKDCTRLEHLNLSFTRVTDAGLARFAGAGGLRELFLVRTPVTDAAVARIKEWKELTYLEVQGTRITPAGVKELQAALPRCKIRHDGGVIESGK